MVIVDALGSLRYSFDYGLFKLALFLFALIIKLIIRKNFLALKYNLEVMYGTIFFAHRRNECLKT